MFTVRPFDYEADLPLCVALMNADDDSAVVTEQSRRDDNAKRLAEGIVFQEKTVVDPAGVAVGYSYAGKRLWASAGKARIVILVDPAYRGQGAGAALLDDATNWANGKGFPELYADVRDDDPASLNFAERRGFTVERQRFVSVLDVENFDETPFLSVLAEKEAEGIRLVSLAELGDTEENRRKLYDLNCLAVLDEPSSDGSNPPFDEFSRMVFAADWFLPEGQILALDTRNGEKFIGLAAVGHNPQIPDKTMFNAFTGTHPDYRGLRIALALKLLTIRLARRLDLARIRTYNDCRNVPMLAINDKLGYVRQPGRYQLAKSVEF